jgi:hypothetical protein
VPAFTTATLARAEKRNADLVNACFPFVYAGIAPSFQSGDRWLILTFFFTNIIVHLPDK